MSKHGNGATSFELRPAPPELELHRPIPSLANELELLGRIVWSDIEGGPLFDATEWVDSWALADIDAIRAALLLVDTRAKFDRVVAERPALSVVPRG